MHGGSTWPNGPISHFKDNKIVTYNGNNMQVYNKAVK